MDRFLDVGDRPKLNGEETDLNTPMVSNDHFSIDTNSQQHSDGLSAEVFKEERKPALYKLFLKTEKDASKLLLHSLKPDKFYMPKPDKVTTTRILLTNISWA